MPLLRYRSANRSQTRGYTLNCSMSILRRRVSAHFAGTPQRTSRFRAGMFAVLDHLGAVHKNMLHASRVLLRLFECRVIGDARRIKHDHVGEHSFFQKSAMIEPEIGRR